MPITDSRYGEYINYNGREAKFISQNFVKHTIVLEIDGKRFEIPESEIDWNDLFGMNRHIKADNEKRISEQEARLEELDERIQQNKKQWTFLSNIVTSIRHSIRSLFKKLDINSADKITEKKDREVYDNYVAEKTDARFAQIDASSAIQADVDTSIGIICHKHSLELQNLLV